MDIKKNTEKLFSWYKELPPWAKATVVIGGAATAIYTVHYTIKSLKAKKSNEKAQQDLISYVNDVDRLAKQGIYPSFQESQYRIWANAIEQQFAGCDGTLPQCDDWLFNLQYSASGNTINNILKQLKNDSDFLLLQTAWGSVRTYDDCGVWPFNGNVTASLSAAVANELTTCEIKGLNKTHKKKNINYKF